jgi:CheY-like chemotaxis protein
MTAPARLLVVDDDDLMRALVAEMLEMHGYTAEQATSGASALAQIAIQPPDLVVLDLWMPGMHGWEVVERLKDQLSPPPVLVMSGMEVQPPAELKTLARHVCGFLAKPFTAEQLLKACALALDQRTQGSQPPAPSSERRRFPRRKLYLTATLLCEGYPAATGAFLSLSEAGAELEVGAALKPGTSLTLSFEVPGGPFQVKATVKNRTAAALGLEFADLSAADRSRLGELLALQR